MMQKTDDEALDEAHNQDPIVFTNKLANRTKYEFDAVKKRGFAITRVCIDFMVLVSFFPGGIMTGPVMLRIIEHAKHIIFAIHTMYCVHSVWIISVNVPLFHVFQCGCRNVEPGQATAHILEHVYNIPAVQIREQLISWIGDHRHFALRISKHILGKKGRQFDDYVADMALNIQPFDEIALFLCARMFGHHYTIFFRDMWINTHSSFDYSSSKVYLLFRGETKFDLLISRDMLPSNDDEPESWFQADPNDVEMARMKLASKAEEEAQQKTDKALNRLLHSTVINNQGKAVPNLKSKPCNYFGSRSAKGKGKGQGKSSVMPGKSTAGPSQPPSPARTRSQAAKGTTACTTRTSRNAGRVEFAKTSQKKPTQLDVYGRPKNSAKQSTKSTQGRSSVPAKSAKGSKVAVKTAKGKVVVTRHAIPKKKPSKRSIRCPRPKCKQQFHSQKDVNQHLQDKHPTYRFECRYCGSKYSTANACYKHEKNHEPKQFQCEYCDKEYTYISEWRVHRRTHTQVGLIPCTNCDKTFTTNRSMLRHAVVHQGQRYTCDKCPNFETYTPGGLHQHEKGEHGPGWVAKCGIKFKWPSKRRRHEKHCDECKQAYVDERRNTIIHRARALKALQNKKTKPDKDKK